MYRLTARRVALAVATVAGFAATTALAQSGAPPGGVRQACAADYKTLCSGVRPGGGRILACFRDHATSLSPGCQQALQSAKAARQSSGSGS